MIHKVLFLKSYKNYKTFITEGNFEKLWEKRYSGNFDEVIHNETVEGRCLDNVTGYKLATLPKMNSFIYVNT